VPGNTYCYFIRVWNNTKTISSSSNQTCFNATGLPGPSYVYINTVSVNTVSKQVDITFSIDTTNPFKGCQIFKSLDGINFYKLAFIPFSASLTQYYTDTDVNTTDNNYYYKIEVADDCNNPGVASTISKTILLKVSNDNQNVFYNTLTWDDYITWSGTVQTYNVYRSINGVFDANPIANVPFYTKTYVDNVQDFINSKGKFSYYVEAVEGVGNIYGFKELSKSNPADAYVEVSVFVPNAFAPKGLNNVWLPITQYIEKTDYKVMVFDRWGAKVFETQSDTLGWDGGSAKDDIYVYLIEYKNARGEYIQLKGHITVLK
jgi:gliding motility-associated-like protein